MRRRLWIGQCHHDEESRIARIGCVPLLALDDPLVAFAIGFAGELFGIRSGLWLGHRERRNNFTIKEGLQIARLLCLRPEHCENLSIARVRSGRSENRRRPMGSAEDLVHQRQLELAESLTAKTGVQMAGPQSALFHLLLQRLEQRPRPAILHVIGCTIGGEK